LDPRAILNTTPPTFQDVSDETGASAPVEIGQKGSSDTREKKGNQPCETQDEKKKSKGCEKKESGTDDTKKKGCPIASASENDEKVEKLKIYAAFSGKNLGGTPTDLGKNQGSASTDFNNKSYKKGNKKGVPKGNGKQKKGKESEREKSRTPRMNTNLPENSKPMKGHQKKLPSLENLIDYEDETGATPGPPSQPSSTYWSEPNYEHPAVHAGVILNRPPREPQATAQALPGVSYNMPPMKVFPSQPFPTGSQVPPGWFQVPMVPMMQQSMNPTMMQQPMMQHPNVGWPRGYPMNPQPINLAQHINPQASNGDFSPFDHVTPSNTMDGAVVTGDQLNKGKMKGKPKGMQEKGPYGASGNAWKGGPLQ